MVDEVIAAPEERTWVKETFINQTRDMRYGDSDWSDASGQDRGTIYRHLRREYGRCSGKVFSENVKGDIREIGWVFEKREKYDDSPDTYIREVWVEVRTAPKCGKDPCERPADFRFADGRVFCFHHSYLGVQSVPGVEVIA